VIDRRRFIRTVGGTLLAGPLTTKAQQQPRAARIGFLGANSAASWASRVDAFRSSLRDLGYLEGKNLVIEFLWADENYDRLPFLAAEFARRRTDILVTYGTPATLAAKRATSTIPIVMVHSGDAVIAGLVADLARPGGNITGSTFFVPELMAKRLELLKDAVPRVTHLATLVKLDNPLFFGAALQQLNTTARALVIELQQFEARGPDDFESAFSAMAKRGVEAVAVLDDAVFIANARRLAELGLKQRLPSAGFDELAEAGGLIGYGVDFLQMYRRAAVFVDKILKGARPGDLPVEQATKFRMSINLKTARSLGLTIPQSLLLRADEVIR
jgi:putative ABC transport system substrate-binding protein